MKETANIFGNIIRKLKYCVADEMVYGKSYIYIEDRKKILTAFYHGK